jgi:hypothetical protein
MFYFTLHVEQGYLGTNDSTTYQEGESKQMFPKFFSDYLKSRQIKARSIERTVDSVNASPVPPKV